MYARHGDLSFHPITEIPKDAEKINHNGKFVLARGEHTGHAHVLTLDKPEELKIFKDATGRMFFAISEKTRNAVITHEEHKTIVLAPGIYEMKHEREFDYCLNETRRVVD
jgi:hypothetical protein